MKNSAFVCGCTGLELSPEERAFYHDARPWGLILFARNCETPEQIRQLIADFRRCIDNPDAPVLIDQEGGRVQRLGAPHWLDLPSAQAIGALGHDHPPTARRAARLHAALIGTQLHALNITINCAPVLDLRYDETHDVIGNRSFGGDPYRIGELGRAACEGYLESGVLPVIKHIPGQGRAASDSHMTLPRIRAGRAELRNSDFLPFVGLADMPIAMTAHVLFEDFDARHPATQSSIVINEIIRAHIGFEGLLLSDDLSMKALTGSLETRAREARTAGCDIVLHCNGVMDEMRAVARGAGGLEGRSLARATAALKRLDIATDVNTNGRAQSAQELEMQRI